MHLYLFIYCVKRSNGSSIGLIQIYEINTITITFVYFCTNRQRRSKNRFESCCQKGTIFSIVLYHVNYWYQSRYSGRRNWAFDQGLALKIVIEKYFI
jgi:hypothetical protein